MSRLEFLLVAALSACFQIVHAQTVTIPSGTKIMGELGEQVTPDTRRFEVGDLVQGHVWREALEADKECNVVPILVRRLGTPDEADVLVATERALEAAGLCEVKTVNDDECRIVYGSSSVSSDALEAWLAIEMMNRDSFAPTLNLHNVDPRCASLDYIVAAPRALNTEYVMSNNFAFGGINTSLIFRRVS